MASGGACAWPRRRKRKGWEDGGGGESLGQPGDGGCCGELPSAAPGMVGAASRRAGSGWGWLGEGRGRAGQAWPPPGCVATPRLRWRAGGPRLAPFEVAALGAFACRPLSWGGARLPSPSPSWGEPFEMRRAPGLSPSEVELCLLPRLLPGEFCREEDLHPPEQNGTVCSPPECHPPDRLPVWVQLRGPGTAPWHGCDGV